MAQGWRILALRGKPGFSARIRAKYIRRVGALGAGAADWYHFENNCPAMGILFIIALQTLPLITACLIGRKMKVYGSMLLRLVCVILLSARAAAAQDMALTLPPLAEVTMTAGAPMATRALPIGPFQTGKIARKTLTAPLSETAYRIPATERIVTADLMAGLQSQIIAAGFDVLYQCDTRICGGFDFRYGMDLLPEPDMHVDLGDFRYALAVRGDDVIALMVSRSPGYGFVQVTKMGAMVAPAPKVVAATKSAPAPQGPIADALGKGDSVVLEGLEFAPGKAELAAPPDLGQIADWMAANPARGLQITGHTDSSGSAAANQALSLARAETIRALLMAGRTIDPARITALGAGDTAPRADNSAAEGRAKNRRVEVRATP